MTSFRANHSGLPFNQVKFNPGQLATLEGCKEIQDLDYRDRPSNLADYRCLQRYPGLARVEDYRSS